MCQIRYIAFSKKHKFFYIFFHRQREDVIFFDRFRTIMPLAVQVSGLQQP